MTFMKSEWIYDPVSSLWVSCKSVCFLIKYSVFLLIEQFCNETYTDVLLGKLKCVLFDNI